MIPNGSTNFAPTSVCNQPETLVCNQPETSLRGMQIGRSDPKQYINIARVRIVQSKRKIQ